MLECHPGYKGFYPTPDAIILKGGVDLGFTVERAKFTAHFMGASSLIAGEKRPWAEGCGPALKKLKRHLLSLETVELTVHRKVTSYPTVNSRAVRNRKGDVQSVKYIESELHYESYDFELAGFKFNVGQILNGKSRDL